MPGIAVVSLPVTDQQRAADFYARYLGFRVVADQQMGDDLRWLQLGHGDERATLTLTTWFDRLTPGTLQGIVLHVDDPDSVRASMVADGHGCSEPEDQPWGRFFTVDDPDGNGLIVARTMAGDRG